MKRVRRHGYKDSTVLFGASPAKWVDNILLAPYGVITLEAMQEMRDRSP